MADREISVRDVACTVPGYRLQALSSSLPGQPEAPVRLVPGQTSSVFYHVHPQAHTGTCPGLWGREVRNCALMYGQVGIGSFDSGVRGRAADTYYCMRPEAQTGGGAIYGPAVMAPGLGNQRGARRGVQE